jgi:predicted PurR-regulated permease PerM
MSDHIPGSNGSSTTSPRWSSTTKLIVGLTMMAILAALVVQFRNIIGPVILAFILAYLLHPIAGWLSRATNLSWRASVAIVFILMIILIGGLSTVAGLAIAQQVQSLFTFVQRFINNDLPRIASDLSTQTYYFGPFVLDFTQFNFTQLTDQILGTIQPLLSQAGTLIGTFASGAVGLFGWIFFVILVAYFLLNESGQMAMRFVNIEIPGYGEDIRRWGSELRKIWDSFLRGQLAIIILVMITYSILLTIVGLRFSLGLAILAGFARFVPYLGQATILVTAGLVALLQGGNYFNLQPTFYALLVVGLIFLVDQIFDNLVNPTLMGRTLGVHPAAVLVSALIAARLIGIIGLMLVTPVLATLQLIGRYVLRKMLDMDPWQELTPRPSPMEAPWLPVTRRIKAWWRLIRSKPTE